MSKQITIQDIIDDIHALQEDLETYERKYGLLSETIFDLYESGEEPENDDWVLDWGDWASAYRLLLRRREQYKHTIQALQSQKHSIADIVNKTSRREPIPIVT